MKKTLTVNLNNIVFHIDDDAYETLQTYLSEIAGHFQSEDERREIMSDVEARIAELFTEKLQRNKNVINEADVQEIIEVLGKPNQFTGEEEETEEPKSEKGSQRTRRFYRDPENAILGGIAGGLSAYLNMDVTLIRIILVLLVFFGVGFIIPVYIVVWLIAPQAVTASQRLEMQGEDVTVENIKSELNNAKSYLESDKFKQSASHAGERFLDIFRMFLKIIFGFVGAVLGIVGIALIFALVLALFFLVFEPSLIQTFIPGLATGWTYLSPDKMVLLVISLILLVGCPIFLIVFWAVRLISGRHTTTSHTTSWVMLILWLAGMFMFYSIGANAFFHLNKQGGNPFSIAWSDKDSTETTETRTVEPFSAVEVSGAIELTLDNDTTKQITVATGPDYLPNVITKVENGVLHIYTEKVLLNRTVKVHVHADSLQGVKATGACKIATASGFATPAFELGLTGACRADLDLQVAGLCRVNLTGASQANLSGTCSELKVDGMGACQLEAHELIAKVVRVTVSGASQAKVYASESLDATAIGASHVDCKGSPKDVNKESHIGSEIHVE
ncbi:MAG TPA: DUF2807 domain-containing protein [Paludibacter sp.]|nr:DUF2807 domain-containing protein [Paludibacter sp.]